jgi:hypothetical protein
MGIKTDKLGLNNVSFVRANCGYDEGILCYEGNHKVKVKYPTQNAIFAVISLFHCAM